MSNFLNIFEYFPKIRENEFLSKTILACLLGAQMDSIHEIKNAKKSRDTAPLNCFFFCFFLFIASKQRENCFAALRLFPKLNNFFESIFFKFSLHFTLIIGFTEKKNRFRRELSYRVIHSGLDLPLKGQSREIFDGCMILIF